MVSLSPYWLLAIEWTATGLGLLGVWLGARGLRSSWYFGAASTVLSALLYHQKSLWGQFGLQGVFLASAIYGFFNWSKAKSSTSQGQVGEITLRRSTPAGIYGGLAAAVAMSALLRYVLSGYTPPESLTLDAALTAFSLLAEWWLARRVAQNWLVWIGVDVVYTYWFFRQGLYGFTVFYAGLTAIALYGYVKWKKTATSNSSRSALIL